MKILSGQPWGIFHGNQCVGIARIANNQDLAVLASTLIQCTALHNCKRAGLQHAYKTHKYWILQVYNHTSIDQSPRSSTKPLAQSSTHHTILRLHALPNLTHNPKASHSSQTNTPSKAFTLFPDLNSEHLSICIQ
jgi:hypothetical protein